MICSMLHLQDGAEDELEWLEHSFAEIVKGKPAFMHPELF